MTAKFNYFQIFVCASVFDVHIYFLVKGGSGWLLPYKWLVLHHWDSSLHVQSNNYVIAISQLHKHPPKTDVYTKHVRTQPKFENVLAFWT